MSSQYLSLLDIPFDVRLIVYEAILADHQSVKRNRQPSNAHILILHTCRQIFYEASPLFHKYVSLRNDWEVDHYLTYLASESEAAKKVRWADVANDGRVLEDTAHGQAGPASRLYLVLGMFLSLEKLRVFNVRHYHPHTISSRYRLNFELAMFPGAKGHKPLLHAYELHLDPSTRANPFQTIPSDHIRYLRLSGDCHFKKTPFPVLRHLTIQSVTSNALDQIRFDTTFPDCQLDSFIHAQGHRLGFEIRDAHLESLLAGPGSRLRKLVLLGSSRLSSAAITSCLRSLPTLEYFALCLITVNELRENFILALGPSLQVLKLQITHAWYAVPLFEEERIICDTLEERILLRHSLHKVVHVSFHSQLMAEDGRQDRWKNIAVAQHLSLKIGPWEDEEET
ncbi:uncharacterized protein EDB91DRAFT_1042512 [Suillus paluster]|uniref:uncharacterized protein n=1 Tax=Suillus paluster TaxID=48578 RepID=UPI001B8821C5|nr:uncharacterized protein EDB91DRAFT_1042512 [Suillus paluster]KAG1755200.1 hypothetical protein EDB91DRAFT_1042512 [Suillus paluster]